MRIEGPTPPAPDMGRAPSATATNATLFTVINSFLDLQKQAIAGALQARERIQGK